MDAALIASAALLGLAGAPHCTAMCGAPCAAVSGRGHLGTALSFQFARLAGYSLGGALAASSVGALAALAQWSPLLKPLWTLLHVAALALGAWLLWQGRQPQWMANLGRTPHPAGAAGGWQRVQGPARAALAGGLWIGWPCGLLQSALLVSALTQNAASGAAAMAAFAALSSAGLWLAPWIWSQLGRAGTLGAERWAVRSAGAMLVLASGWSLGHGLWQRVLAYCLPG